MNVPRIQWYPGHIAKAERQLSKSLNKVDLVIEVRDARIPLATSHPQLQKWISGKQHLLVINRKDMVSQKAQELWDKWFRDQGHCPWWTDAKTGKGVKQMLDAAVAKGNDLNQRRISRGMLSRPVRALTLGFPNVGKSALINRLMKKKVVESARRAGVTRSLRWVRMGNQIDLLDAPGILPPRLDDQQAALHLALCDDIGEAAYDIESIAIAFLEIFKNLESKSGAGINPDLLIERYGLAMQEIHKDQNFSQWLLAVSERHTSGDTRRMSQRIIDDFRRTLLGLISLELPQ